MCLFIPEHLLFNYAKFFSRKPHLLFNYSLPIMKFYFCQYFSSWRPEFIVFGGPIRIVDFGNSFDCIWPSSSRTTTSLMAAPPLVGILLIAYPK